ncbi:type II toxin-antitoxin system Phd/YefM family antitoxin [Aquiflexum sp.]|uniref:type II toxin-antitoxin system Phd/YefM family antitoxin n=1 Tax=Aquiflexum sp. TaxID=1872584 RepID=UPI0035939E0E
MITVTNTEFRNNMKELLDQVVANKEGLILKRGAGKGVVIISLEEYNSIMETMHLLGSKSNAKRLFETIDQLSKGKISTKTLIKD